MGRKNLHQSRPRNRLLFRIRVGRPPLGLRSRLWRRAVYGMTTAPRGISDLVLAPIEVSSATGVYVRGDIDALRTQGDLDNVARLELAIGFEGKAFLTAHAGSEHRDIGLAGAVRSSWRSQASQLEFFLHAPQLCALTGQLHR